MKNDLLLFLAAFIWGISFVAQRAGMDSLGPFTFNGLRYIIGAFVLLPIIVFQSSSIQKKKYMVFQKSISYTSRDLFLGGFSSGIILFIASSLQQFGMVYTTAGKAGFITALYIVIVPILGIFIGKKVKPLVWFSVVLAATGFYVLSIKEGLSLGKGDFLILVSAFGYSLHILVIDYFSSKTDGVQFSAIQFLVSGLISLPLMIGLETITIDGLISGLIPLLYAGIMSCGVAYTLQVIGQKNAEPAVASLILSLESVFALIAGMVLLQERISGQEAVGCIIVFSAILFAQFPTGILQKYKKVSHIDVS